MGLGVIGLGTVGTNLVQRLRNVGHQCVVYGIHSVSVHTLSDVDPVEDTSIEDFVRNLSKPRAIWMMARAADVDATLSVVIPHLDREDVVIVGGDAHCGDDVKRSVDLKNKGVHYVEIGTSLPGHWAEMERCMMVDGPNATSQHRDHVFSALQPAFASIPAETEGVPGRERTSSITEHGYLNSGSSGPVCLTKTAVDDGVTNGLTAAYSQGMTLLHNPNAGTQMKDVGAEAAHGRYSDCHGYNVNLADLAEVWRRGSVVSSWLLDMAANALRDSPGLDKFAVRVSNSDEGRWTVVAAIDESIHAPVLTAALYERFGPLGEAGFADKVLSALSFRFRGHEEEPAVDGDTA